MGVFFSQFIHQCHDLMNARVKMFALQMGGGGGDASCPRETSNNKEIN